MNVTGTARAAEILGVSTRTVIREVEQGKLPIVGKIGGYLFDEAAIVRIRSERIAAERARLDELEATA